MSDSYPTFTRDCEFHPRKAQLNEFLETLSNCGEVLSIFIKPRPTIHRGEPGQWLQEFMQRFAPLAEQTVMGRLDLENMRYSRLHRYELEGSLIGLVRDGGCHGLNRHLPLAQVRQLVAEMLEAVFPAPFTDLWVYRFEAMDWCPWMREATDCAGYLVWQADRDLWWLLCVCDED